MARLLALLFDMFAKGAVFKFLAGAGLGLGTSAFLITFLNYYISKSQSSIGALGAVTGLVGLSGLDKGLSIIVGALVARVTLNSLNVKIYKA